MGTIPEYFSVRCVPKTTKLNKVTYNQLDLDFVPNELSITSTNRVALMQMVYEKEDNHWYLDIIESNIQESILENDAAYIEIFSKIIEMCANSIRYFSSFNFWSHMVLLRTGDMSIINDQDLFMDGDNPPQAFENKIKIVLSPKLNPPPMILFMLDQLREEYFEVKCLPNAYQLMEKVYQLTDTDAPPNDLANIRLDDGDDGGGGGGGDGGDDDDDDEGGQENNDNDDDGYGNEDELNKEERERNARERANDPYRNANLKFPSASTSGIQFPSRIWENDNHSSISSGAKSNVGMINKDAEKRRKKIHVRYNDKTTEPIITDQQSEKAASIYSRASGSLGSLGKRAANLRIK